MGFRQLIKYVKGLGDLEIKLRSNKITLREYMEESLKIIEKIDEDKSIPENVKSQIRIQKNKLNVLKSQLDEEKKEGEEDEG